MSYRRGAYLSVCSRLWSEGGGVPLGDSCHLSPRGLSACPPQIQEWGPSDSQLWYLTHELSGADSCTQGPKPQSEGRRGHRAAVTRPRLRPAPQPTVGGLLRAPVTNLQGPGHRARAGADRTSSRSPEHPRDRPDTPTWPPRAASGRHAWVPRQRRRRERTQTSHA